MSELNEMEIQVAEAEIKALRSLRLAGYAWAIAGAVFAAFYVILGVAIW